MDPQVDLLTINPNGTRYTLKPSLPLPRLQTLKPEFKLRPTMVIGNQARKGIKDCPKKIANLIDLANVPSTVREFVGQSQISRVQCFIRVWSYIKSNNLQDPNNKNVVNCDEKLKSILMGKEKVNLARLPSLIQLHFPKSH